MKIIIPSFNNGKYAYTPNHLKGLGVPSILELFYDEKIKRETLFYTFSTFGFLPLLDVAIYPLVIEHYLERFVFTQQGTRFDLGFHYNSILVPVLFMGTLNIFDKLRKRTFPLIITIYSVVIIVWVILFSTFVYHGPIGLFFNLDFYRQRKNLTYMDDFVKIFPKSGIVLTQSNLGARLTHGPNVRLLRDPFVYLHPDYVILDLTPGQRIIGVDPMAVKIKDYYLEDDAYILTKVHDDQYLFSKK